MENLSYHEQEKSKILDNIRELCDILPPYVFKYIRSIQYTTTPKTRLEYVKDIKNFLEYSFPDKNLNDITSNDLDSLDKDHFEAYFDYLQEYEKDGIRRTNGLNSIKRKLCSLRGFFGYLFNEDLIKANIVTKVKNPKLRKKEIVKLNHDEMTDFLNVVEHGANTVGRKAAEYHEKQKVRDLALTTLLLSTGIRVSECAGIDMDDIDFASSSIRVLRKGEKEDRVYFSDECSEYLFDYFNQRKHIEAKEGSEKAFFLSSQKKRMSVRSIEILIKKYATTAVPLKNITPHKLRSTFGTALYKETSDISLVAEALGHNDINTSRKFYADMSEEHKSENRNKVSLRNM